MPLRAFRIAPRTPPAPFGVPGSPAARPARPPAGSVRRLDVLGQRGNAEAPAADYLSPIYLLRAGEDAEHRGLARAVGADEPDPRPRVHLEVQAPEHGPSTVKLFHGPKPDKGHAALPT